MKCPMAEVELTWADLSGATREMLSGKLAGLWGAESDAAAFDSWPLDKKHALLLLLRRMDAKKLWHLVKRITNVYGEGGVGLQFEAWPMIESTLSRRNDFTRMMANHKDTTGGFYEKQRAAAVLHFAFGATGAAYVLVGMIMIAATLESALGLCLGCKIFGWLMRAGVIPESVCERCTNL